MRPDEFFSPDGRKSFGVTAHSISDSLSKILSTS